MHNFDNNGFERLTEEENDNCTNQDQPQATPYQPPPLQPYYDDPNHDSHDGTNMDPPQVPPYQPPQPQTYYDDPNIIEPHDGTSQPPEFPPYQPPQPQPYYDDPNHGPQAWAPVNQYVMTQPRQTMPPIQGQRPRDWTVPALVTCIFCCMPLGLAAIIYAHNATTFVDEGNMVEARKAARTAKVLIIVAIVSGIVIMVGFGLWSAHVFN